MEKFKKILEFEKLMKEYNSIRRDLASIYSNLEPDNDVEHSYRVALLVWMVIEEYKFKLDSSKAIKYALIHDLVEVYAGDHSIYGKHKESDKKKKEHQALLKLKKKFPKLKNIWKLIDQYELKKDEESKFVYILEKLEPILLVLLSEKDHWFKRKIPFELFKEMKLRKIKDLDSVAHMFTYEIIGHLEKNGSKYFPE
jgi:putative hydrolase of HD superfamily